MKNEALLRSLIREHVRSVLESQLNESFKSGILRKLLTSGGSGWRAQNWSKLFYNTTKVALDKVEDSDFTKMTPADAYKNLKKESSPKLAFYVSEKGSENPYAKDTYGKTIKPGTLIGVATGDNKWYEYSYSRYSRGQGSMTPMGSGRQSGGSIGIEKQGSGYGSTGIYNVKRGAEIADTVYVLDLLSIQQKYSTKEKVELRTKQKSGAVAFMTAKQFKDDNMSRYNEILRNKAAASGPDNIIKGVQAAIQEVSAKMSAAVGNMTTGRYNNIILGQDPRGKEVTASDAANFMRNMLDNFERYIQYSKQDAEAKAAGSSSSWYAEDAKKYALELKKQIQKAKDMNYAW